VERRTTELDVADLLGQGVGLGQVERFSAEALATMSAYSAPT
jgi:hypothetical protein